jgi:asparagine synthase (glutamine-hydrolysing)
MCGISGILSFNKISPESIELVKKMNDQLIHRGPDSEGFYSDEKIALGFRRLKIIDLVTGDQPISNEDGSIWTLLNGEIYNFQLLKNKLRKQGHFFKTNSDTETIVHAYEEYGLNFLSKMRGMFAIALWDKKTKKLILARDRVGKKPLYYYMNNKIFAFASEIKALLQLNEIPRDIDRFALDEYFTYQYIPAPRTILKHIKKIPPAHFLIVDTIKRSISIKRYWDLEFLPKEKIDLEEASYILRNKLKEAVKLRMISDVPIGALLSGGIDSSIVVGLMSELSDSPVHTFSIGFDEKSFNEAPFARQVANQFGTKHEELIVRPSAVDVIPKVVHFLDEPMGDSSAIPTYYVSKIAKKYVTVVLNGDGGDEVFSGYNRYGNTLFLSQLEKIPSLPIKILLHLIKIIPRGLESKNFFRKLKTFSEISHLNFNEHYTRQMVLFQKIERVQLFSNEFKDSIFNQQNSLAEMHLMDILNKNEKLDQIDQMLLADTFGYLPNDLLVKMDRMSMANSLEARSPFLDHDIIEFVAQLPSKYKRKNKKGKILLKETFSDMLPSNIINRPKQGFGVPLENWFRKELKEMLFENLLTKRCKERGYYNISNISKMINDHVEFKADYSAKLYSLLILEMWHQEFLD